MNIVRDRPAAKWLPSRHRFALARLAAFAMLLSRHPQRSEGSPPHRLILAVDRDQSAIENYAAAIWFLATTTCFIAAFVPLPVAFPLAFVAVQLPICATGLVFNNRRLNSAFLMLCGTAAALYFATTSSWVRFAAYIFLGVLALDAVAAVVLWLLRGRVRAAEQRCLSS